ncbi:MAG: hypothetical protein JW881_08890 [Spirochaetales bacterium]|nr:hypothetical protein [Spirochaetales bacterium]
MKIKNKLSLFFILFFVIMGTSFSFCAECGDADDNERVDIVDALHIARYYVGLEEELAAPDAADVNNDDTIDIRDALLVAQYYVGSIDKLQCGDEPAPTALPSEVWVARPSGIQCEVTYYENAMEARDHLESAGITVLNMRVATYPVITLCGVPTGTVYEALIRTEDLEKAEALGWG